jgi:hypothetical protein
MATWDAKVGGMRGEKLVVDRIKGLVFVEDVDCQRFHIFDTSGNYIRCISLEEAVPKIKWQNESYDAGSEKFGYRSSGFALAGGDKFVVCGRHNNLYIVSYDGALLGIIPLPSDDWQEDIAIDANGQIHVLYQEKGVLITDLNGRIIQHLVDAGVHFCNHISIDSEGSMFVTGRTTRDQTWKDDRGILYGNFWSNGMSKLSREGIIIKKYGNFTNVGGITVDSKGNLYATELSNRTVSKLTNELELVNQFDLEIPESESASTIDIDNRNNCYVLVRNSVIKFELPI